MQLLQDVGTNRCRLTESVLDKKESLPKGVLGILEGICSDFTQATRNDNFYSRELWERILDSEYVKECLETKTLFGALDHPESLENLAGDAAVSCTDLWIDETEQCLKGKFNVLPTPRGKILDALLKTGSILGVSCRGVGDLSPNAQGTNTVDPETYNFVCFDVVTQPAAVKARQQYQKLTESQKLELKPVLDALMESISVCKTQEDLESIQKLSERLGYNTVTEVQTRLQEQLTYLEENSVDKLTNQILLLEENKKALSNDLEKAYRRIKTLESSMDRTSLAADISYLRTQISKIDKRIEEENSKDENKYNKLLENLSEVKSQNNVLKKQVKQLESLQKQLSNSEKKNLELDSKIELKESIISDLNDKVEYSIDFVDKCRKKFKLMESNTAQLEQDLEKSKSTLKSVKSSYAQLLSQKQQLEEELKESKKQTSFNRKLKENLQKEYARQKELDFGVSNVISDKDITNVKSLKEIDRMIIESNKMKAHGKSIESDVVAANKIAQRETNHFEDDSSVLGQIFSTIRPIKK